MPAPKSVSNWREILPVEDMYEIVLDYLDGKLDELSDREIKTPRDQRRADADWDALDRVQRLATSDQIEHDKKGRKPARSVVLVDRLAELTDRLESRDWSEEPDGYAEIMQEIDKLKV